jgi:hypothetical protein
MKILRRTLGLILPALLLLAQHGALAHLISHLDSRETPAQEKTLGHLKLCGKCVSLEKLSHAAQARNADAAPLAAAHVQTPQLAQCRAAQPLRAFRSRAPPPASLTA